ncbi:MAG: NAD(P)/FAD-dependent oxidoreductase [Bacteroidetes bacterium]|nr:NAD(P)/FAD-dependent oxidoreductase [Bacteroidota bacterium]
MVKDILILGAGFGGLEASTSLREKLDDSFNITLIDKNEFFTIGFTKFDVMFGRRSAEEVKSYYKNIAGDGINFVKDTIELIDPENNIVKTQRSEFSYDFLIIALGADLAPDAIPGFVKGGYEFYSLQGAQKLYPLINNFKSGTILISIFNKPYKCPPAPYEAALLLHDYFVEKGIRGNVQINVLIPGPMPLPVAPNVSSQIEKLLEEKDIKLYKKHKVIGLDPDKKIAFVENNDSVKYDLFLGIPVHVPPKVVRKSAVSNNGWISVNKDNLETKYANVYAVGDVTNIPVGEHAVPKAGAFAESAAQIVVIDILAKINNETNHSRFEGTGICYIEVGGGNVVELNANILGGEEPILELNGPEQGFRKKKELFEKDRIKKWFK